MSVQLMEASPQNFDRLITREDDCLVVVDFYGPNCPNCELFADELPALLADLSDLNVAFVKCNAYAHRELAERFSLLGVPTFLLFRRGKLLGRMSQYRGRSFFTQVIREQCGAGPSSAP